MVKILISIGTMALAFVLAMIVYKRVQEMIDSKKTSLGVLATPTVTPSETIGATVIPNDTTMPVGSTVMITGAN